MFKYILFDVDETLYPPNAGLMQEIGARISLYMLERMEMEPKTVEKLRKRYWIQYGTTLRGLALEHEVDPEDYLAFVHDIDLTNYIAPSPPLVKILNEIPMEKVIFTNASTEHAHSVTDILGVKKHFARVFDVRAVNFIPKPDRGAYQIVLDNLGARGEECIMLDDAARNLVPAKELGMTTVWVRPEATPDKADFAIKQVIEIENVMKTLLMN